MSEYLTVLLLAVVFAWVVARIFRRKSVAKITASLTGPANHIFEAAKEWRKQFREIEDAGKRGIGETEYVLKANLIPLNQKLMANFIQALTVLSRHREAASLASEGYAVLRLLADSDTTGVATHLNLSPSLDVLRERIELVDRIPSDPYPFRAKMTRQRMIAILDMHIESIAVEAKKLN